MAEGFAVLHLVVLYDVVCHQCGWDDPGNPYTSLGTASDAAAAHECAD